MHVTQKHKKPTGTVKEMISLLQASKMPHVRPDLDQGLKC